MKLVDILAVELKRWPDSLGNAVGQASDGTLHNDMQPLNAEIVRTRKKYTMCKNYVMDCVTRAEWQAAVDALNADKCEHSYANNIGCPECGELNAPKVVEWDGVGDPPAMSKIEYKSVGGTWKRGVFVGRVYGKIVAGCDDTEAVGRLPSDEMRPIRTAEQVAAEERGKAINLMIDDTSILTGTISDRRTMARQLYDAGYRKEPKPCGS